MQTIILLIVVGALVVLLCFNHKKLIATKETNKNLFLQNQKLSHELSAVCDELKENLKFLSAYKTTVGSNKNSKIVDIRQNSNGELFYVILDTYNDVLNIFLDSPNYRANFDLPCILCRIKTDKAGAKFIYQEDIFAKKLRVGNGSLLEELLEEYARENNIAYIEGKMVASEKISLSSLKQFYLNCGFDISGAFIKKVI